jgi:hypothetical protein
MASDINSHHPTIGPTECHLSDRELRARGAELGRRENGQKMMIAKSDGDLEQDEPLFRTLNDSKNPFAP